MQTQNMIYKSIQHNLSIQSAMKLYFYRCLDDVAVPKDGTRVIVDEAVTVIKRTAFFDCIHIVSVIIGDKVKRIK